MIDLAPTLELREKIATQLQFSPQTGENPLGPLNPIGYSVDFVGITNKNLLQPATTDFIAQVMRLHDISYKQAIDTLQQTLAKAPEEARPLSPEDFTVPQPAFSRYLHLVPTDTKDLQYHMTVSPTINSHGGIMEIGGIQLIRGPEHPFPLPKGKRDRYEHLATRAVLRLTKNDKSGEVRRINNNQMLWRRNRRHFNEEDHP